MISKLSFGSNFGQFLVLRRASSSRSGKRDILSPREIYAGLQEHVVGQHNVKVAFSVGVHNHLLRCNLEGSKSAHNAKDKSNNPSKFISL
jgi:ATP-dependent protease Clp ATPase subunit